MADVVNLKVDGRDVSVPAGSNLAQAVEAAGVYLPHLCWEPGLEADGACGLCAVGLEGGKGTVLACETRAEEGMAVVTGHPEAVARRRRRIEVIKSDHADDCQLCPKNEHCQLQEAARAAGVDVHVPKKLAWPSDPDKSHPLFNLDRSRCILCGKCVKVCRDLQGLGALEVAGAMFAQRIRGRGDVDIGASTCEACGQCVDRCPTASLLPKVYQVPTREVRTVCPYCGVGCAIHLGIYYDRLVSVRGDPAGPANRGALCVKGRFGIVDVVNSMARLETPQLRDASGAVRTVSWDEAFDAVASRLRGHVGKGSFAMLASAKATNEEDYLIQKFARAVMGTNNVDHCARLCHSPSVAGLTGTLGSGAMTCTIDDIDRARGLFVIGSNTTETHPVIGARVRRAKRAGATLVVCDPRRTDLASRADVWLRHRPGSDVALLAGICRAVLEEGLEDRAFIAARTEGFEAFQRSIQRFTPDLVERITGVGRADVQRAARALARGTVFLYAMGITQHAHGTDNVRAVSDLALLTGNVGTPGSGIAPLRGQNNVQGGGDVGALPDLLPGYQRVDDPAARARFAAAWGTEPPAGPGLALTEMWDAVLEGRIRAMWIVGENPFLSDPDSSRVERALRTLDLLIVQEVFPTDTTALAHIVLPAATFAEKDGTFTNTERRVQLVRKALEPMGRSRPDWWIVCEVARRMGARGFDFASPSEVMDEIARVTPQYAGISHGRLAATASGIQWPCPSTGHPGTSRLHTETFPRPGGRAAFAPLEHRPVAEPVDADYPMVLTTGRTLVHFHTGSMTRRVPGLNELRKEELVEINPADATALSVVDGTAVRVTSRRGSVTARARVTERSPPGTVFMTFHFSETPTNRLTIAALDPDSRIAEAKVCAVRVEAAAEGELPSSAVKAGGDDLGDLF